MCKIKKLTVLLDVDECMLASWHVGSVHLFFSPFYSYASSSCLH